MRLNRKFFFDLLCQMCYACYCNQKHGWNPFKFKFDDRKIYPVLIINAQSSLRMMGLALFLDIFIALCILAPHSLFMSILIDVTWKDFPVVLGALVLGVMVLMMFAFPEKKFVRMIRYARMRHGIKCKKSLLWLVVSPLLLFILLGFIQCMIVSGYF